MDLRAAIEAATGAAARDIEPLGGGCIGQVYAARLAGGGRVVVKADERGQGGLPVEAFMLSYLRANSSLPVPAVLFSDDHLLIMEHMPGDSVFAPAAERHAAELLAALHAVSAPRFGFERDTRIGGLPQPNPWRDSWVEFFAGERLVYMAGEAARVGRLPVGVQRRVERFAGGAGRWIVEPAAPSLIHGDAWTTNILSSGGRITAFLDPAIYYADAEIELAFTTLFGTFGDAFFRRYHELRPIAAGFFEERRDLYNLYPLLVHVRLFGGSYVGSVDRTLRRFGY